MLVFFDLFLFLSVMCVCFCVRGICKGVQLPQRPEGGTKSLEAGVSEMCELPNVGAENHSGLMEEPQTLLTSKLSLAPID